MLVFDPRGIRQIYTQSRFLGSLLAEINEVKHEPTAIGFIFTGKHGK